MVNLAQLALQNDDKYLFLNINKGLLDENHHYQIKQYTNILKELHMSCCIKKEMVKFATMAS